ncbi:MAG: Coenzyme F420 hydrogenase/dehydrogenase, beta subunit C-terminal domain [Desulfarculaceae bacterium]|nr:Coenzyme F420 hydrogenase/dehydrogenase, beta subunit C-terminal domain [Desulfarculaceae bacterium]MCF8046692.1 Coenzyme F420 hydrogenase/dehydrogenase, beta subunit C-terminal domain [Desulfarculaceae bacterium]MCF8064075.1 Coenzyme F420 hydrogenase/dehydrogenase, beta subunit C-terminal domain [Desulfarculaceae bacterium]MCF8097526.1 Coenzyme F420 hydrogenase/dehydrogenase, beta subunit C-terminal domain [Desulfarculaceae bacterium]MCF8121543.1 Coenzyme F420 hydrogenase/dehydrogenase, bet
MITRGPRQLLAEVQEPGLCIGCGSCVELCPYFRSHGGKTVMLHDCDLPEGRCHAWCPKTELDLEGLAQELWGAPYSAQGMGPHLAVVAAKAGPRLEAGNYQAGGTVSALACAALEQGLVQGAILTGGRGLDTAPTLATTAEEVMACSGSKFTAAPTLAALNRAQAQGRGPLAVVATPCQAAALAQRRTKPSPLRGMAGPAELVVGLFCNWSLSPQGLERFLAQRVELEQIRSMDIPPPPAGVLQVQTTDGSLEIPLDEIRDLIPPACAVCPDMTSEWADLSVGMYEGRPGWNTLVVRNEKARALTEAAVESGWLVVEEFPADNQEHLMQAAEGKRSRGLGAALAQGLLGGPGDDQPKAIRVSPELYQAVESGEVA